MADWWLVQALINACDAAVTVLTNIKQEKWETMKKQNSNEHETKHSGKLASAASKIQEISMKFAHNLSCPLS